MGQKLRAGTAAFIKYCIFASAMQWTTHVYAASLWREIVKTPPCTMTKDPQAVFPLMSLCLKGAAGTWVEQRSKVQDDTQPPLLLSSRGSATMLFTSWLVFRADGYANIYQNRTTGKTTRREAQPETLLVQIGNSSTHRHRIFAGKSRIPFGLNLNVDSSWGSPIQFDPFYGEVIKVAGYTYDNQRDLTLTISGGTADNVENDARKRKSAAGVRAMYDLAALEGTRLVVSFSTDELEHRRGQVGAVNVNGKGDITAFEVIRIWSNFPFDPLDFSQLIRLSWQGSTYQGIAPHSQYEDQLEYRRIGSLGARFKAKRRLDLDLTVGYCRDEVDTIRSYWFGVAGVEVHL